MQEARAGQGYLVNSYFTLDVTNYSSLDIEHAVVVSYDAYCKAGFSIVADDTNVIISTTSCNETNLHYDISAYSTLKISASPDYEMAGYVSITNINIY